jgi:regulator of protease activity HflC (stomatin/prohibitin superfamily)
MVQVAGLARAGQQIRSSLLRMAGLISAVVFGLSTFYAGCTARVRPNELGVQQKRLGSQKGIVSRTFGPGLYFVGPGTAIHTFPREIHVLEASYDRQDALARAQHAKLKEKVQEYFAERDVSLGASTHRTVDALNVQTSDGYAVTADVTLLYTIADPVKVAREFGWGSLYVDSFVVSTFRNGILATLGKMNAESFYDGAVRIKAIEEAEGLLRQRFQERGFAVEKLLLRNFRYADNYEKSLRDKKVAVQLAEKNRKESLVNEEKAKLQQIQGKGDATITIAESEITTRIAKVRAEAELYSSQVRARADTQVNLAHAEAKRLKAEALTQAGGRYVVALETSRMFDNIDGAVMTPEQYIAFVRSAWALIGVSGGGSK